MHVAGEMAARTEFRGAAWLLWLKNRLDYSYHSITFPLIRYEDNV
jgi:hypothetical protein